jgi:hypothetical protein
MKPGQPARIDCEYARNGVANLFMMFALLEGWRHVKVTDRRTAVDFAPVLKDLADVHFAQAATLAGADVPSSIPAPSVYNSTFASRRLRQRYRQAGDRVCSGKEKTQ